MPSYLDLGAIALTLASAFLSMLRGLTREVLTIVSWGAAFLATLFLYTYPLPYLRPSIPKEQVATLVSILGIFFLALFVISIMTHWIADTMRDSRIRPVDRWLGFVFGLGRGFLLCVVIGSSFLQKAGGDIQAILPENFDATAAGILKLQKNRPAGDVPATEGTDATVPMPPSEPPAGHGAAATKQASSPRVQSPRGAPAR